MNSVLVEYMKKRFKPATRDTLKRNVKPGPVITISRDFGCPAKKLARTLTETLTSLEEQNHSGHEWRWIGKEILEKSAKELNLHTNLVRDVATKGESSVVDDIVMSLSHKFYPGERKVKKKIGQVIRQHAELGHVIVVGRGGVSIAHDIEDSLHVKLQAPIEWRINVVSKNLMISLTEAKKKINEIDHQRQVIREFFEGKKVDNSKYDIIYNFEAMDEDEIVSSIVHHLKYRDIL